MKISPTNDVRDMYEAMADSYAKMMDQEIDLPVYAELLGRLQEQIADTPGSLLDTACGPGHILAMFADRFDSGRPLVGVDLSPGMVSISREMLGDKGTVHVGDMRAMPDIAPDSAAAVLNIFALHHLDKSGLQAGLMEWWRVLVPEGRLVLAAWEGSGTIDFGDKADIIALRYTADELTEAAATCGFTVVRCRVDPVEGFPMDAVYLEGIKNRK